MVSPPTDDFDLITWSQRKFKGLFRVRFLQVKDCSNSIFRQIPNTFNDNHPVTQTYDGGEINFDSGVKMMTEMYGSPNVSEIWQNKLDYDRDEVEKLSRVN